MSSNRKKHKAYPRSKSMFLDDFRNIYSCSYKCNDELEEMLSDDISDYLEELFTSVTEELIDNGRAYVEMVIVKDDNGDIKEIGFNCLHSVIVFKGINKLFFILKTNEREFSLYSVDKKMIIFFDLKELGYSRFKFKKIFKRADELEEYKFKLSEIIMDRSLDINFNETVGKLNFMLLKCTSDIYWDARMDVNCYLNDFYNLWRKVKLSEMRIRFLDYMLMKINNIIKLYGFQEIMAETNTDNYSQEFIKLQAGEMTRLELADKLFSRK